jgi:hypothetical protein
MTIPCRRNFTSCFQVASQDKRWWEDFIHQVKHIHSQPWFDSNVQRQPENFFQNIRVKRKLLMGATPTRICISIQKPRLYQDGTHDEQPSILNYDILPAHHHFMGAWSIIE